MKVRSLLSILCLSCALLIANPGFAADATDPSDSKNRKSAGPEVANPPTGLYYYDEGYDYDYASTYEGRAKVKDAAAEPVLDSAAETGAAVVYPDVESAAPKVLTPRPPLAFSLTNISAKVVKEFQRAWSMTASGRRDVEAVVLLFRLLDGSYIARSQGSTNERKKFTFNWVSNAIAIVHTHPNDENPKPSDQDKRVAEKFGVPVFTITLDGMYMYDPKTKQTTLVKKGLDWHDPAKWLP